ncbi:MAG: AzlD domain-containing protein [Desulfobacterales bacterium]|nr:AzlD domain-containing protein [Desulfobacterales bacterium]
METMDRELLAVLTIVCAALVTYGLRIGGLLLSERLPTTGRFKVFMDALPGTLLVSLIAPGVAAAGLLGALATGVTAICTYRTGNIFLSMLAGVAIVAGGRWIF